MIANIIRRQCIQLVKIRQGKIFLLIMLLTFSEQKIVDEKYVIQFLYLFFVGYHIHLHLRNFSAQFNMSQAALDNISVVDIDKEGKV